MRSSTEATPTMHATRQQVGSPRHSPAPSSSPRAASPHSLSALVPQYLQYLREVRGYSALTARAYSSDLRQSAGFLQDEALPTDTRVIEPGHANLYLLCVGQDAAPATVARKISALRGLFAYAQQLGLA